MTEVIKIQKRICLNATTNVEIWLFEGTYAEIEPATNTQCYLNYLGDTYLVNYIDIFNPLEEEYLIENAFLYSTSESVLGYITEMDGYDENDFPSWMLVLNLI